MLRKVGMFYCALITGHSVVKVIDCGYCYLCCSPKKFQLKLVHVNFKIVLDKFKVDVNNFRNFRSVMNYWWHLCDCCGNIVRSLERWLYLTLRFTYLVKFYEWRKLKEQTKWSKLYTYYFVIFNNFVCVFSSNYYLSTFILLLGIVMPLLL